jgi:hypothetical protein
VQAVHGEVHRDNESFLVLMFALNLYWDMTRMILAVVNRKSGTRKTTVDSAGEPLDRGSQRDKE